MDQLESLPLLDLISLVLLMLIAAILLINRTLRTSTPGRSWRRAAPRQRGALLTGGIAFEPDGALDEATTDTNDPLLLVYNPRNHYIGPEQTALALTLLDEQRLYAQVGGHIAADLPLFMAPDRKLPDIGSTDLAASAPLYLLDPEARLAEEALEGARFAVLPALRVAIILLALLALLYRLLAG